MMYSLQWKTILAIATSAAAVSLRSEHTLDVTTSIGTFRGFANASTSLEAWLGIPFAQPPVDNLRFKAPVPIATPFDGVQNATKFGAACPQPSSGSTVGVAIDEDCLVLNVFRPENTTAKDNLPVLVWIYGGSFNTGAASSPAFNPTLLINRSVAIGKPIIFVSLNYRINAFGFLASSYVDPKDLNAGLQDQTLALTFVHNEISAFGGDPDKVTIWGQSAGGGSVESHLIYPPKTPLFRAAIADSSSGPFHSAPFAAQFEEPGKPYARLTELVACPAGAASLPCLEKVPFEVLLNASNFIVDATLNSQAWYPAVGPPGSLVPVRPSDKIAAGDFLRVPYISGTNLNDGTIFSHSVLGLPPLSLIEEDARFNEFIGANVLDNSTLTMDVFEGFDKFYPANDSSLGGPFNTGDSLFDRAAAWYTDNIYLSPRRLFFDKAAPSQELFAYLFAEFYPGANPIDGVSHGSELALIFGGAPASEKSLSDAFTDAWINFVTDLNPGSFWPRYNLDNRSVLQWKKNNITVIRDDFDLSKTNFENTAKVLNEFEK